MQITMDPNLPVLLAVLLAVFFIGLIFLRLKQPILIAYLLVGVAVGPHGLGILVNAEVISWLGNIGVLLLLFFLGMDMPLPKLLTNWKISIVGTFFQILGSIVAVFLVGCWLDWPLSRVILLGFVISLSSTSIILRLLHHAKASDSQIGNDVIGISLTQDLAVVPMLIVLGLFRGEGTNLTLGSKQLLGTVLVFGITYYLHQKKECRLPLGRYLSEDEDIQLFAALCICFGAALITAYLGLSTAIGAFVAGLIVRTAKETHWVKNRLEPFRIFLMALFFISVGMMIDFRFIQDNKLELFVLTVIAMVTNTFINAGILKALGRSSRESLYGGALLAQISEFSFVLASVGLQSAIISRFSYN
ncbi:MAG: cation:proton antiporter, partial [Candidatus Omnitrophica bacterium]|nr:cation:proton antiporter [Candidatus Omnitrophota bacterium]